MGYAIRTYMHFEDWYIEDIGESKSEFNNDYNIFYDAFQKYYNAVSVGYSVDTKYLTAWLKRNYTQEEVAEMSGAVNCQIGIMLISTTEGSHQLIFSNFRDYDFVNDVIYPDYTVIVDTNYLFSEEEISTLDEFEIEFITDEYAEKYFPVSNVGTTGEGL